MKNENKNWFVANNEGVIAGHDLNETAAKTMAMDLAEKEPEAEWEAIKNG